MAVKHLGVFTPLRAFTLQGPIKPTCTISMALLQPILQVFYHTCFFIKIDIIDKSYRRILVNTGHVIVTQIVASVRIAPG
jgi:hypothetical protein